MGYRALLAVAHWTVKPSPLVTAREGRNVTYARARPLEGTPSPSFAGRLRDLGRRVAAAAGHTASKVTSNASGTVIAARTAPLRRLRPIAAAV